MPTPSTVPPEVLEALSDALGAEFALGHAQTRPHDKAALEQAQRAQLLATHRLLQVLGCIEVPA